jgi:hypothetical protein
VIASAILLEIVADTHAIAQCDVLIEDAGEFYNRRPMMQLSGALDLTRPRLTEKPNLTFVHSKSKGRSESTGGNR